MKLIKCLLFLIILLPSSTFADQIDFSYIQKFGEFAKFSYEDESSTRKFLKNSSFELSRYREITEMKVSYYLATDHKSKTHIIVARGTNNIENVIVDLKLHLEEDPVLNIVLHRGFAGAANAIYKDVKSLLKKDYKIQTTGHSLGGAIAVILAMYLDKEGYKLSNILTFGQPKVTNVSGAGKFEHLRIIRVVTKLDIVPLVPPLDPVDIKNIDIFWHLGIELILLEDKKYSITKGLNSMLRATKFFKKMPDKKNLKFHKMDLYLDLVGKKLESSEKIPYKNDFSFLDMF